MGRNEHCSQVCLTMNYLEFRAKSVSFVFTVANLGGFRLYESLPLKQSVWGPTSMTARPYFFRLKKLNI